MPWPSITVRDRREQVRDDIDASLPGADSRIPNSPLRFLGDAQSSLTQDNDKHLEWVARQMMPDTAEGEFAERWGNIWLPDGRKAAIFAGGEITVTGNSGASIATDAELTAVAFDDDGEQVLLSFSVPSGVTLAGTSATVSVEALTSGALGNLEEGSQLAFVDVPDGIDGIAVVAAPGLAGGADIEPIEELRERYINRIQEPPHGGNKNDWEQWARDLPGVTRAWGAQEMGIGTYSVRFMMDDVRASNDGLPLSADTTWAKEQVDLVRPVTAADTYLLAPIKQLETVTITDLANDTPEIRANVETEVNAMLRARAKPGGIIYASWVREAISAATGEDHHDTAAGNLTPASSGHMIFIAIAYS